MGVQEDMQIFREVLIINLGASGQNMAWTGTMEDSANMWASEGPSGGHYRIMRNYQTVGCGISKSCSVVVCDYQ